MYPQPIPFLIANWPLALVFVVSGAMLVYFLRALVQCLAKWVPWRQPNSSIARTR
jgi:hypothetical protein